MVKPLILRFVTHQKNIYILNLAFKSRVPNTLGNSRYIVFHFSYLSLLYPCLHLLLALLCSIKRSEMS